MIIKRYSESRKVAEELQQYNVLHVDTSEFSRYAIGSVLMEYDFIVKKFASVKSLEAVTPALQTGTFDLLLVNAATMEPELIAALKKIKKHFPEIAAVVYNFSSGYFEKMQLLKAGINAIFDPDTPFEELLFALQEVRAGSVCRNVVVEAADLKKVAQVADDPSEFSKEEVAWIREYCKEPDMARVAEACGLPPAASSHMHRQLQAKAGCVDRADFIRLAMLYKWIRTGKKLLAATQAS